MTIATQHPTGPRNERDTSDFLDLGHDPGQMGLDEWTSMVIYGYIYMVNIWLMMVNNILVGGFNPSEKILVGWGYDSQSIGK